MGREGLWSVGRLGGMVSGGGEVRGVSGFVARWDHGLVQVHMDRLSISFV